MPKQLWVLLACILFLGARFPDRDTGCRYPRPCTAYQWQEVRTVLTSAQILALHTTAVPSGLLPSGRSDCSWPGIQMYVAKKPAGIAYATAGNLLFRSTGGVGNVRTVTSAGLVNSASQTLRADRAPVAGGLDTFFGAGVDWFASAAHTTGDSPIFLSMQLKEMCAGY